MFNSKLLKYTYSEQIIEYCRFDHLITKDKIAKPQKYYKVAIFNDYECSNGKSGLINSYLKVDKAMCNWRSILKLLLQYLALAVILAMLTTGPYSHATGDLGRGDAWDKLRKAAELLLGEGGFLDDQRVEGHLAALVDLHVVYCSEILGRPIPSERVHLVKTAFASFLSQAAKRYQGNKRRAVLQLLRDVATNRAIFVELLASEDSSAVLEQQLLAYMERNARLSYTEPVRIEQQLRIPPPGDTLEIPVDGVRLVSDQGTYGHANGAIDAGEVVTLNVSLRNVSDEPFRSTSGFLQSGDQYITIEESEVIYTETSDVSGETMTFPPGHTISPTTHFTFTVSPLCPDGHRTNFNILAWDSDRGKFEIPFAIRVNHVGPLDFGQVKLDDDVPGPSDGNANGILEPKETIEYVINVRNIGPQDVTNVVATLWSPSPLIRFADDRDTLNYSLVEARAQRRISASFIFSVDDPQEGIPPKTCVFRLLVRGTSRGHEYSWIRATVSPIGVSNDYWESVLELAKSASNGNTYRRAERLLGHSRLAYRVNSSATAMALLSRVRKYSQEITQLDELAKRLNDLNTQMVIPQGRIVDRKFTTYVKAEAGKYLGQLSNRIGVKLNFIMADGSKVKGFLHPSYYEAISSTKYNRNGHVPTSLNDLIRRNETKSSGLNIHKQVRELNEKAAEEEQRFLETALAAKRLISQMQSYDALEEHVQAKDIIAAANMKIDRFKTVASSEGNRRIEGKLTF